MATSHPFGSHNPHPSSRRCEHQVNNTTTPTSTPHPPFHPFFLQSRPLNLSTMPDALHHSLNFHGNDFMTSSLANSSTLFHSTTLLLPNSHNPSTPTIMLPPSDPLPPLTGLTALILFITTFSLCLSLTNSTLTEIRQPLVSAKNPKPPRQHPHPQSTFFTRLIQTAYSLLFSKPSSDSSKHNTNVHNFPQPLQLKTISHILLVTSANSSAASSSSSFRARLIITFRRHLLEYIRPWGLLNDVDNENRDADGEDDDEMVMQKMRQKLRSARGRTMSGALGGPPRIPERKSSLGFSVRHYDC
ncbi:hypothetical protein QBC44DRAFT_397690 [Cladorrhinum sp. PSN332]|nr:hypothetical protein QBC44DRAFT_397690 [Cladorrhinum sp. PSN332]